ncbi:TauD/TfdA dioxygenase family protein [Streptomyces zagrosensis]|uniref:Alpha-ketoglutarate-dependent taurine dioxygenase n=1 Tax=Streptomyces zagrosensis TaxID=1042984 RepID=A0A7W9QH93_9ACTN|nr:TauD/TfdA family dioxygenase [Streptomyces zagrosensis]MBB5939643.1 alpha-ketoglutarate-dependent taurine dioxygenase [Streptomyces zagrosensis]
MTSALPLPPGIRIDRSDLKPFGLVVESNGDTDLNVLPPALLARWVGEFRVVVLRGFAGLSKEAFADSARRWGPLLTWDFGEVLDLVVQERPTNYLFTPGCVPYHWDGAFAEQTPAYMFFQCVQAPMADAGGETSFIDTTLLLNNAGQERRAMWDHVQITYTVEKKGHFGGKFTTPLVSSHPITGRPTLRYAEPLPADEYENPLSLTVEGIPASEHDELLTDLHERLYHGGAGYTHTWQDGDYLLIDNHAVLHRRESFRQESPRRLQRVQIL